MTAPTDDEVYEIRSRINYTDDDTGIAEGLAVVVSARIKPLLNLIRDLTDRDECWFDHHGGCQAHGCISLEPGEKCPHAEAKEILQREGIQL